MDLVVTAIKGGGSLDTASRYAGIAQSTMRQWLADGRNAMQMMGPHLEDMQVKVNLVRDIDEAMASFKLDLTLSILGHGRETWQAHAWLLERRFPDEFGRRQRIDHANAEGQPFQVAPTPVFDPSKLTDEELEQAIALLNKARPDGMKELPAGPPSGELRVIEQ